MKKIFTIFAFKLVAQSRLSKVLIGQKREKQLKKVTIQMTVTITVYLGLHFLRSYLSFLMYTADPKSSKIVPLSFSVIGIEFICFIIDIAFVLLFLVFFLEQRKKQRNSIRQIESTSLWDRWHFCMILSLLVAVDLGRTCYRTLFMVSFDIQFK